MGAEDLPGIANAQTLGLTLTQIAQAVQADELSLDKWLSGISPGPNYRARLAALDDLVNEMNATFRTREAAREWLHRPLPSRGGQCPLDLILDGKAEVLVGMLYAMNSGMSL